MKPSEPVIQSIESEPHPKTQLIMYSYDPTSPSPHLSMFLALFILGPTEPQLVKPSTAGKSHDLGHYKSRILQPHLPSRLPKPYFYSHLDPEPPDT